MLLTRISPHTKIKFDINELSTLFSYNVPIFIRYVNPSMRTVIFISRMRINICGRLASLGLKLILKGVYANSIRIKKCPQNFILL